MDTFKEETTEKAEKERPSLPSSPTPLEKTPVKAEPNPLPPALRYLMLSLLVVGVVGAIIFAFLRQTSVKPVANSLDSEHCADPVTENRLRETVRKSPNDYSTLMDWGDYNLNCNEPRDYASAISAFQGAARLADNSANNISAENRIVAHFNLGLAYLYNKSFKEAENEFHLILNEQPRNSSALFLLGATLSKDDPQQALVYLRQAIEASPDSPVAEKAQGLINDLLDNNNRLTPGPVTPKA